MSRRRYLSSDAGRDRALRDVARASLFAHSLYLLGIPCAADDCTLPTNDPEELLWEVWPAMARDYGTDDVQAAIDLLVEHQLWEYATDGCLRYPPRSFYKHQTYIRGQRRGGAQVQEERATDSACATESAEARTAAQPTINGEKVAQNSAKQRTSAQNSASLESSFSFSSSFSSPPLPPPTATTPAEGLAPDADAPDAEPRPKPSEAPLVVVEPVPKPRPRDPVWDTLAAIYGEPMLDGERSARNGICKQFRDAARKQGMTVQQMAALIGRAHGNWANVMGGVTETPNGLTKYFTTLLEGPQVNGRSNGTVTAHTQHLRELATVNRGPKRGSAALDDEWRLSDHAQPGGE
jgi:hypothetical protein